MDAWDLDDDALHEAFLAAKADIGNDLPTEPESDVVVDTVDDGQDNLGEGSDHDGGENLESEGTEADLANSDDNLDGGLDEDDKQPADDLEEDKVEPQPVQKYKYKANGKEYEFTADEIMERFPQVFGQAMDYTRKMQQLKPYRKTIDAIEQANLNHDDINLMIDVLKGDKAAIAAMLKRTGVDALDLDVESGSKYVPNNYGRDENALALKDVVDEISQDQEYSTTHSVLTKQWDERSWNEMASNPELIKALHIDVKSGVFKEVQAIADKMKLFDGGRKSDLDYYKLAAREHYKPVEQPTQPEQRKAVEQTRKVEEVKRQEVQRKSVEQASAKRKAAAPTKTGSSKPSGVTDYLDDSDEGFDSWYQDLKDSQ